MFLHLFADVGVTLLEALNAAGCVHELLRSGKERVARAANSEFDFFLRRASLERIPAAATNDALLILGMYIFFHNGGVSDRSK